MNKRWIAWFLILLFAVLASAQPALAQVNLLENGGFETVQDGLPASWEKDVWFEGSQFSRLEVTTERARSGERSVLIESVAENDAKWVQTVRVEPDTLYRLSGWLLVESAGPGNKGANLSVLNVAETSADFADTAGEWEYVELYGRTGPEQEEVKIAVRLGGYGSLNIGKAYFDDIEFVKIETAPQGVQVISFESAMPAQGSEATAHTTTGTPFKVLLFALVYLMFFVFVYVTLFRQKRLDDGYDYKTVHGALLLLLAGALVFRLVLAPEALTYRTDMVAFQAWSNHAAQSGLSRFYLTDMFVDYPPGYIYVLYLLGLVRNGLGLGFDTAGSILVMKLPAILADVATAYLLFRLAYKRVGGSASLGLALLYMFNPAVIVNSTFWGQVDSFFVFFLLLTFASLVSGKLERSGIWFAISVLIKPQALIFTPALLYAFYRARSWKRFGIAFGYGLATLVVLVLPFSIHQEPWWIFNLYYETLASYPYATINAFNLLALLGGNWEPVGNRFLLMSYSAWGMLAIVASVLLAVFYAWKSMTKSRQDHPGLTYFLCMVLISTMFLFGSKMHERYWFPVLVFLLALFMHVRDRRVLMLFAGISTCHFINVAYVLVMTATESVLITDTDGIMLLVSAVSLLLYGWMLKIGYDGFVRNRIMPVRDEQEDAKIAANLLEQPAGERSLRWTRKDWLLMGGLTLLYAVLAFYNLGSAKAPETVWQPAVSRESFIVDFGANKSIHRINSYAEIGDGQLTLEFATEEEPDNWGHAQTITVDYTKLFTWQVIDHAGIEARYVKVTVNRAGLTLNELAFYERDGERPIPIASLNTDEMTPAVRGEPANLFDEPEDSHYHPTYMHGTYFDEIYHARTAYEHLHNMKPYETTHPPLGKLLILIGIKLFGMNPFGWRFIGTLFGVLMIPIMYVFGKRLFRGSTFFAFLAAFLMAVDFMHFAQTRIATIDTYGVFFIMLMYYFMFRYMEMNFYKQPLGKTFVPLFWSGLFFGIGAASKWIVIYGGAGLAILFFWTLYRRYREYETAKLHLQSAEPGGVRGEAEMWQRVVNRFVPNTWKTILVCIPFFVIIPALIYSASFLPYMTVPGEEISIKNLIQYQLDMWNYHSKLVATHGFSTPWWEWPFIIKPIWFYSGQSLLPDGQVSSIVSMGNPAIWWFGLFALIAAAILAWRRKHLGMAVVITAYLSQYLPWMLVTRLTFIYHYFAMVPFLILAIAYLFKVWLEKGRIRKGVVYGYMAICLGLFAMFYPILSGAVVSKDYVQTFLRWFPTWYFYS